MDKKVLLLTHRKQYTQRTPEWYEARRSLITASSAASLLIRDQITCSPYVNSYDLTDIFDYNNKSCNPYSNKTQYLLDKCKQKSFKGNVATFWGQKYEPVVTDLYSVLKQKEVMEFGLLIHPEYPFLGASPDGITPDGTMIEIKCPFRRKITGVPPLYYWIQVQLQLEVCDLDICDFVEYEFTEFKTEEEFLDDTTLELEILNKGLLIQVEKARDNPEIPCNLEDLQYIYPPKELLDNTQALLKWLKNQLETLNSERNELVYTPVFWKVTGKSILPIKRDREWFSNVRNTLESEWKQMVYYQKDDNYKKLLSKQKVYTEGSTLILHENEELKGCLFSDSEASESDKERE